MHSIAYIAIGILTAIVAGVAIHQQTCARQAVDYLPAIIAGCLWPVALALVPIAIVLLGAGMLLEGFMRLCIAISKCIDEHIDKGLKTSLEKDAEANEP